jgi:hypothetical protein
MEAADRDNRGFQWIVFAAHESLQGHDDAGGEDDRVLGILRRGAVAAEPLHVDVHRIDVGESKAGRNADYARGKHGGIMKGEQIIRLRKAREQPVVQHGLRAHDEFLAWLQDHDDGAGPLILHRGEAPARTEPCRHVRVMAAGVHHARVHPVERLGPHLRREGKAGLLGDRERVHVGADQQNGAWPILHHGDDAGLADMLGHLETELAHLGGKLGGGSHLLHRQLGVSVDVPVERHELRHVAADRVR